MVRLKLGKVGGSHHGAFSRLAVPDLFSPNHFNTIYTQLADDSLFTYHGATFHPHSIQILAFFLLETQYLRDTIASIAFQ